MGKSFLLIEVKGNKVIKKIVVYYKNFYEKI